MNDENNIPEGSNAQQPQGEGAPQPGAGIEARINELTALIHKKDETITKLADQLTQQQLAALQTREPVQTPEDQFAQYIPKDASDEQKAVFTTMFGQFAKLVDAKLSTVQKQVALSGVGQEVEAISRQYGVSEAVAKKTQELLQQWRQDGLPFNAHDAVRFAAGEVALQTKPDPRAGQQVPVFRAANPQPQMQPPAAQPLPNNFDDLSIEEQWSLLAKRVGDKPL